MHNHRAFKDVRKLLAHSPQCIGIVGVPGSGKTTLLQSILLDTYKLSKSEIRRPNGPVCFIDAFTDIGASFADFYQQKLTSFCQMRSDRPHMLVVDDVDAQSQLFQTQLYAFIQRYADVLHIVYTCTHLAKVSLSLQGQSIHIYLLPKGVRSQYQQAIYDSIVPMMNHRSTPQRIAHMETKWRTLYDSGVLVMDIFAFVGKFLQEPFPGMSPDEEMCFFQMYKNYTHFMTTNPTEHLIEFYFLADALCTPT